MEQTDMQRVKETVMRGEGYLHIKRVPKPTIEEMIAFMNSDEFGRDWGMAIKYIWDTFKGTLPLKDEGLRAELAMLNERIERLEQALQSKESAPAPKKAIRVASGKTLEITH